MGHFWTRCWRERGGKGGGWCLEISVGVALVPSDGVSSVSSVGVAPGSSVVVSIGVLVLRVDAIVVGDSGASSENHCIVLLGVCASSSSSEAILINTVGVNMVGHVFLLFCQVAEERDRCVILIFLLRAEYLRTMAWSGPLIGGITVA